MQPSSCQQRSAINPKTRHSKKEKQQQQLQTTDGPSLAPENRDQASPVIASFSSAICPSPPPSVRGYRTAKLGCKNVVNLPKPKVRANVAWCQQLRSWLQIKNQLNLSSASLTPRWPPATISGPGPSTAHKKKLSAEWPISAQFIVTSNNRCWLMFWGPPKFA